MMNVTRRTALKAAAGILSFPILGDVRNLREVPRWVVDRCCDKDYQRYDLSQPIIQSTHGFATDGRVMLILDDVKEYAGTDPLGKFPNCVEVVGRNWTPGNWQSWKLDEVHQEEVCQTCTKCWSDGMLGEWKWCNLCDGEPVYATEDEMEYYPASDWAVLEEISEEGRYFALGHRTCVNGRVGERCDACDGRGVWLGDKAYRIGEQLIAPRFALLLNHLPDIEYSDRHGEHGCVSFRFNGGRGLVMPLRELTK